MIEHADADCLGLRRDAWGMEGRKRIARNLLAMDSKRQFKQFR